LCRRDTFEGLEHWLQEISQNADPSVIQILIGNQADDVEGLTRFLL